MYSIIIADDEKKIRTVLNTLIHWDELQLELSRECMDGDELLNVLTNSYIDIVITDMKMPGVCGVELLQQLSKMYPHLPILVVSGYDDFKYTKQAIVSQAIDYILKPIDEDELNEALKKAIQKARDNRRNILNSEIDDKPAAPVLVKYFSNIYEAEKNISGTGKQNLVFNIKKYLDENYSNHITLSDLEKNFFSNKEHLSRIFKSVYGVTIFDYIDHLRIHKANGMLAKGRSMKEITYAIGYYDESHFHKRYKKIMGIAPSKFCL